MRKITTKKRILFSFRGQVTINGQIMSEKPGIFCAQNGQKIVGFRTAWGGGNSKDSIVTFNPVEKRENINSGEKHKTIFGKIYRWFADLKPVAFTGSYNDLSDKPSNFAPSGHTHSRAQITDFPSSMPASDVYAWAKAASKPAYTASEVGALPASGGTVTGNVDFKGSYIRVNRIVGINSYLYLPGAKVSGGSGTRCSIFNITSDDISDLSYGVRLKKELEKE